MKYGGGSYSLEDVWRGCYRGRSWYFFVEVWSVSGFNNVGNDVSWEWDVGLKIGRLNGKLYIELLIYFFVYNL